MSRSIEYLSYSGKSIYIPKMFEQIKDKIYKVIFNPRRGNEVKDNLLKVSNTDILNPIVRGIGHSPSIFNCRGCTVKKRKKKKKISQ